MDSTLNTISVNWVSLSDHHRLYQPGAIRAAVLINKRLHIITTTAIKGVSDGGHVVIYPTTDSSIDCLLKMHNPSKDDSLQIMQFSDAPAPASHTSLPQVPHMQQFEPDFLLNPQSNPSQRLYQLLLSHHPLPTPRALLMSFHRQQSQRLASPPLLPTLTQSPPFSLGTQFLRQPLTPLVRRSLSQRLLESPLAQQYHLLTLNWKDQDNN
jgi:hypothetical protein